MFQLYMKQSVFSFQDDRYIIGNLKPGVVVCTCNPTSCRGRRITTGSRPPWSANPVPGQPGLCGKFQASLSPKTNQQTQMLCQSTKFLMLLYKSSFCGFFFFFFCLNESGLWNLSLIIREFSRGENTDCGLRDAGRG